MSAKKRFFLGILVFFATFLMFLSFGVIRQDGGKPSEFLAIHNVVISTDLDDRFRLTGAVSRFPYGSGRIYLRFDYSQLMENGDVQILWFKEETLVQAGNHVLPGKSGSRVYCLTQEDRQLLPKGLYSIALLNGEERFFDFKFEIY